MFNLVALNLERSLSLEMHKERELTGLGFFRVLLGTTVPF